MTLPSVEEGRARRSRAVLRPDWIESLAAWSGCSRPVAETLAWPIVLTPERVDADLALPADAVLVFGECAWGQPVPVDQPVDLAGQACWVSVAGGTAEVATETTAMFEGRVVARALRVARTGYPATPWGQRRMPARPRPGEPGTRIIVVDGSWAESFLGIVGVSSAIHDNHAFAQALGHRGGLVPGLLFTVAALADDIDLDRGQVQTWLRRPVEVGARLTMGDEPMEAGGIQRTFWAGRQAAAIIRWNPAKGANSGRYH